MVKVESRKQGRVDFNYQSAEARAKLPIGKKFSFNAGVIYRTHERPYGYNPIEIWLNELDEDGFPVNYWYELGFLYGFDDIYYNQIENLVMKYLIGIGLIHKEQIVANSDLEFRDTVFEDL